MLLMVEKGIRGGVCHAIHGYTQVNNQYIKDYDENNEKPYGYTKINNKYIKHDKNTETPYLKYWDLDNLNR